MYRIPIRKLKLSAVNREKYVLWADILRSATRSTALSLSSSFALTPYNRKQKLDFYSNLLNLDICSVALFWKGHQMRASSSRSLSRALRSRKSTTGYEALNHMPSCLHHVSQDEERSESLPHMTPHRSYHVSRRHENATLVLGLSALAITAKSGQYALKAWEEYQNNLPEEPFEQESNDNKSNATHAKSNETNAKSSSSSGTKSETRENIFSKYFDLGVGSKYYEGGFEDTMTRREAALILGVRESSTPQRIKEAHRKLLILNHPDTGGSTFLSGKINEAKELLLKGRK